GPSSPGRDSRSAHICSSAAGARRAGTAGRRWSRGGCRRRNRCSRRPARDVHPDFALADQPRLDIVAVALVAQDFRQALAERAMLFGPARQPGIEHWLLEILAAAFVEQVADR